MNGSVISKTFAYSRDVLLELLWPTRCAICDAPGENVVCKKCESGLRFIDPNLACPKCGTPFGIAQCTECNELALRAFGTGVLPFDSMFSSVILDDAAKRIVTAYKDQNEKRLCSYIVDAMRRYIPPEIFKSGYTITYVPDSKAALRRRGFDHSREMALELQGMTDLQCNAMFERPTGADQRSLGRRDRLSNMSKSIKLLADASIPEKVLIIDDVCTTGATLYSACEQLRSSGAKKISALTFGRVLA